MRSNWLQLFARLALGLTFLAAVGDRLGFFGPHGSANVAWGDFAHFTYYTGMVNAFAPKAIIPLLAVLATICETVLGITLVAGIATRVSAIGSAILLGMFALAMTVSLGVKAPLSYSVFSSWAAAMLLATCPHYAWSIDALFAKEAGSSALASRS